jgi:diacylglycerol kinase family enzyme
MNGIWDKNIAVILNANARKVTTKLVSRVKNFVPEAQLYVSKTIDEGQEYVRDIVRRGYSHVVLGGGDGTVVEILNQFRNSLREFGKNELHMPKLGFLKLGTGNAWAGMLGSDNGKNTLSRMAAHAKWRLRRFNLLEADQRLCHFSGMGWDATILNDYHSMRDRFGVGPLRKWFGGFGGYLTSIALKTIPAQIFRKPPMIRVINRSAEVYACSGVDQARPLAIKPGDTLYEGPANVFGGSTTPYYGFGLAAYPFARVKEGFMNFRVVTASVFECVANSVKIFRGAYRSPRFIDFLAKDVTIESDRPMPLQIGGDVRGLRDRWDLSVADFSVQVLDLSMV